MNLQTMIANEEANRETRTRMTARLRSVEEFDNVTVLPLTPSQWFDCQYPGLSERYGDALREEIDKNGVISVIGINEDFLAAALGEEGNPNAPTIFYAPEARFYRHDPAQGIFSHQREPEVMAHISRIQLECARACKSDTCHTDALEFTYRRSNEARGVVQRAKGVCAVSDDYFNSDLTEFIACANGMLRLSDNTLLPFSPSYRRRNKLAISFEPSAKCPRFLKFLHDALDHDDIATLKKYGGQMLTGVNVSQTILLNTGNAGTGKTTLIKILRGVVGADNFAMLRTHLLTERFELGRCLAATVLYAPDVNSDFLNHKGAAVLKSLSGNDPIVAELKNSNETPAMLGNRNILITCNTRLTVYLQGDTDAWSRRLVIIEYRKPKPEKVIADLDQQILREEGSGVLNWLLEGLRELRADGWQLNLTSKQREIVDNLLLESNSLALFVTEQIVKTDDSQITANQAFNAYAEYCNDRGWAAINRNRFGQQIGDLVVRQFGKTVRNDISDPQTGKAQRGWRGLNLKDSRKQSLAETLKFDDPDRQAAWDSWGDAK